MNTRELIINFPDEFGFNVPKCLDVGQDAALTLFGLRNTGLEQYPVNLTESASLIRHLLPGIKNTGKIGPYCPLAKLARILMATVICIRLMLFCFC